MTSAATARGTGSAAGQPAARVVAAVAAGLLGPGYHPEVPARVLALLDRTPTRRDRDQLLGVLRVLDSRAGALALTGSPVPVSGLSPAAAEALVQRWWRSRLPLQRRLAAALFGITMVAGYGWPGPARDATGYPGPLGTAPDVPRRLTPLALAGDQELSCDVVAVGSGAGGGVAAAERAEVSGVEAFVSGEVAASLEAVAERVGVTTGQSGPGVRDALMERGLERLGWHVGPLPRNVRGCAQDPGCGWCGFGCRLGAKQSTMVTCLQDAAAHGARIVVGADVRRVLVDEGWAVGVEARRGRRHRLRVRARAVVAAGGAIETPALLLRSGLRGHVGRHLHLHLHPGTAAMGVFDEPVRWWEGTTQARYSAELRDRLGAYAPIFETVPLHPAAAAAALPWQSAAQHRDLMERSANLSLIGVLCRDTSDGRVRIDRDGNPRVRWRLNREDEDRMAAGVAAAGEVLAAAGATEVFSVHRQRFAFRPGGPDAHRAWAEATRQAGFRAGRATLASYHQMGSCRMGADPATSAVGPDQQTHEVKALYVADSSVCPTAGGVNPMLTVMGLAHRAAAGIADRLA